MPVALRRRRDFTAPVERIADGKLLVTRVLVTEPARGGAVPCYHEYRAFELVADGASYAVLAPGDAAYGRVDTRRPLTTSDDPRAAIEHEHAHQLEAVGVIGELCPEAALAPGEMSASAGVHPGPGYVRVTTDPARRLAAAKAAWRPALKRPQNVIGDIAVGQVWLPRAHLGFSHHPHRRCEVLEVRGTTVLMKDANGVTFEVDKLTLVQRQYLASGGPTP